MELNPYSWSKVANIIYIDQPIGTGFSYAKTGEVPRSGDTLSATHTYHFLKKWLQEHPQFLNNPLYIGGISYIGIVVPDIVLQIYRGNEEGNEPRMNIKGYILANPLTDKNEDANSRVRYANTMALISDEIYESAKTNCNGNYINVRDSNALCKTALEEYDKCIARIYLNNILEPSCPGSVNNEPNFIQRNGRSVEEKLIELPQSASPAPNITCRPDGYVYCTNWANEKSVQKALHVREGTILEWSRCNLDAHYQFGVNETASYIFDVPSSVYYHKELTSKNCRALVQSGDHDMIVPYLATREWIRSMNLSVERSWEPWYLDTQVAGYVEKYVHHQYSLTFATVKGAGHEVPAYKPKECFAMLDKWLAYSDL